MYTYPEALNATNRIATDLLRRALPDVFVEVIVAADSETGTASVDWRWGQRYGGGRTLKVTINMPVRPATYRLTAGEFNHWAAYVLHEIGHPLHTDMDVWKAAVKARKHNLLNSLEDVREEKCTIDLGLAVNAVKVFGELDDSLHAKAVAGGYDPNDPRSIGWTLSLLGRVANGYQIDISDIHAKLDPNGTVGQIAAWAVPELGRCASTQDCLDLADRITDAVKAAIKVNPVPQPEPEEPEEPGQSDSEPEQGRARDTLDDAIDGEDEYETGYEDVSSPAGVAEPEAPAEPEADEPDASGEFGSMRETRGDDGEDKPEVEGDGPKGGRYGNSREERKPLPEPEPEPEADDLFDEQGMSPDKAGAMVSTDKDWEAQRNLVRKLRETSDLSRVNEKPIVGRKTRWTAHMTTVDFVEQKALRMGRQRALLARALKRNEQDDYEGGRLSGRLDRRAIAKLATGNPHVFGKRSLTEGYDTDVQVLVDGSSSMSGNAVMASAVLALVIAQAARQVGVECTAHVFNDAGLHMMTKGRTVPEPRKFAYAYNQTYGCTPLTHNLITVARMQQVRARNKRRVIFVITDGGCDLGPQVLKAAGEYIEQSMGAEIANLHIGYAVMGAFRNEVAVNTRDVAKVGLERLTQTLERGV